MVCELGKEVMGAMLAIAMESRLEKDVKNRESQMERRGRYLDIMIWMTAERQHAFEYGDYVSIRGRTSVNTLHLVKKDSRLST